MKEVRDRHGCTIDVSYLTKPITNVRKKLTICCNGDMGLVESLWRIAEIAKRLDSLILAGLKHRHPKGDSLAFCIRME